MSCACIGGCLRVGVSGLEEGLAPFGAWASAEARASPSGAHAGGAHSCHVFKQNSYCIPEDATEWRHSIEYQGSCDKKGGTAFPRGSLVDK